MSAAPIRKPLNFFIFRPDPKIGGRPLSTIDSGLYSTDSTDSEQDKHHEGIADVENVKILKKCLVNIALSVCYVYCIISTYMYFGQHFCFFYTNIILLAIDIKGTLKKLDFLGTVFIIILLSHAPLRKDEHR